MHYFLKKTSKYALLLSSFLFTGCLGFGDSEESTSAKGAITFEIGTMKWQVALPPLWEETAPEKLPKGTVLLAQNLTQNFIIEQYPDYKEGIADSLWKNSKDLFYYFEGIEKSEYQWSFKAQSRADVPLRHYFQKVFPIPETGGYLLGSCSADALQEENDCETVLEGFRMVRGKK